MIFPFGVAGIRQRTSIILLPVIRVITSRGGEGAKNNHMRNELKDTGLSTQL